MVRVPSSTTRGSYTYGSTMRRRAIPLTSWACFKENKAVPAQFRPPPAAGSRTVGGHAAKRLPVRLRLLKDGFGLCSERTRRRRRRILVVGPLHPPQAFSCFKCASCRPGSADQNRRLGQVCPEIRKPDGCRIRRYSYACHLVPPCHIGWVPFVTGMTEREHRM